MGFFDFFKKRKNKVEETEKLNFDDLETWVNNKRKEIENKEKEIFILIQNRISENINELDEKLKILQAIDIGSKKAEDKIKLIIKENLINYVHYVRDFMENLEKLEKEKLEKFTSDLNKVFSDFDRKSYLSYQKITFLVGKEMAEIKKSILNLSKYLKEMLDENKNLVDSSKTISFVELKLKQINEANKIISELDERISFLDKKIKKTKEMDEKILNEIEQIKKSQNYLENLKKQEEIELDKRELEKEIYNLKEMINFKELGNIFHVNKKQIEIIKSYKENFQLSFKEDNGTSILNLLNEANLNNETISEKIKQIHGKKEGIIENTKKIKKDETKDLEFKTNKIKLEIEDLNNEKIKDMKKYEKIKINKGEIISSIKQELAKINVVLES